MGMFDYVTVTCPHCKKIVEDQTKEDACIMQTFNLDEELPAYIATAFEGKWCCEHCVKEFYITCPGPLKVKVGVHKDCPDKFKNKGE